MSSAAITTISRSNLTKPPAESAKITDFKHIASYTWWDKTVPTISVPGSPPLWHPPSTTPRLEPDSGSVYIDQNAARCPSSPLEPLFRAALIENPNFSLNDVDLVTDRNNIRKLLRFVQASSDDHFRIRVEIVGETTALLTRVEPKTTDTIQGFRGYGRNFEKAYTKNLEAGMNGYHRIVGYSFGGMRCVVRHETDAYIGQRNGLDVSSDMLASAFGGLSLAAPGGDKTASGLTVLKSPSTGKNANDVPLSSILEIKTRAQSRVLDMAEVLPQLWISQTPNLAVGYHSKGCFNNVQVRDMTTEILRWETESHGDLGMLAGLLGEIISGVKRLRDRRAVVEYTGGLSIQIVAGDEKPALPADLYAMLDCGVAAAEANREIGKGKEKEKSTSSSIPMGAPFASDIEYAMRKGPRQFFCRLPGNLSDYRSLCQRLKSLPPETVSQVIGGVSFPYKDIMADLRLGKPDYDPDERREIKGIKTAARDAAFRLVYVLLSGDARDEHRNTAYNAAFFVVSHSRIFGVRTRQVVRAAFEDRFAISAKQRSMMDKYTNQRGIVDDVNKGEDDTTAAEDFWFDSDSDYFY